MKNNLSNAVKLVLLVVFVFSILSIDSQLQAQASEQNTAIFGYLPLSGSWTKNTTGEMKGVSEKKKPAINLSNTEVGSNFVYEANVMIDSSSSNDAAASVIFRANQFGTEGYMLRLEPKKDKIKLVSINKNINITEPIKKEIETGVTYKVKITVDGPEIKVFLNDDMLFHKKDSKHSKGFTGFHVDKGSATFSDVSINKNVTNIEGWDMKSGKWVPSSQGLVAKAKSEEIIYAISRTAAANFNFEADVSLEDANAAGTLIFRSNKTGLQAYGLQIDSKNDLIRLYDTKNNRVIAKSKMAIEKGNLYRIRIKAEGTVLKVYWQNGSNPVISVNDDTYTKGFLGLHAYNGNVVFQNILVSDINSNLDGWISYNGEWTPDLNGIKGISNGAENTYRIAERTETNFVLEGDLKVDNVTKYGTAGLVFRTNSDATRGYMLNIDPNLNKVRLLDLNSDRTVGMADWEIETGKTYHFEVHAMDEQIKVYIDGYTEPVIDVNDSAYTSGKFGLNVYNGTAYFQNIYATNYDDYYSEIYRPQYHYTQARGAASDPNGLVYYEGEYHLFHQDGGKWAHAVSKDLVHWKRLSIAIPWNEMGHAWSGSAVVDKNNVSGLFNEEGSGLIAYYTSFNPAKHNGDQKIAVAYSRDKGRTWEFYEGNPIIPNIGEFYGGEGWDFRDPKVVWDEDHKQWVMVVSGGDHIRFFTSTDLLNWKMIESFGYGNYVRGGVWECPDFFQLPVDGDENKKKWVLSISTGANPKTNGSDSEYFVGTFDGNRFVSDHPAGTVLKNEFGKEMYAAMSFSDIPASDGRRISLGWMSNWDYPFSFPTSLWQGQMSIPRELTLKTVPGEGVRLFQKPIEELAQLRGEVSSWSDQNVQPNDTNLLAGLNGTAYEIIAEFELPENNNAAEFGFKLRESSDQKTIVGYNVIDSKMFFDRTESGEIDFSEKFSTFHETALKPKNNRVKMRIFVDESSIEVFGNDGQVVFSNVVFPDGASDGMSFYTKGGKVKIVSLKVYPLRGIWKEATNDGTVSSKVVMDHSKLELRTGEAHKLSASVLPLSAKKQKIKWQSSNPAIAEVKKLDHDTADVKMIGYGRAVISATTNNGKVIGSTVVTSKTSYQIVDVNSGKALTVNGTTNGSKVKIFPRGASENQTWNFEGNRSGVYKVLSPYSNKVLDASGVANGDDVQVWEYFGYGNQHWRITDHWNGTFSFHVMNSGKSLGVPKGRLEDGTVVEIHDHNNEASQKWKLVEVSSSDKMK
ncbi:GH32 C-terminal domain-containing protein [uncultured Metabacillus sp.]|uniref:GH32 C-terminal domain-containing protein n=1 Tax=uncultured Metabacillus sp. TaxID=2860135 RepID=UPI002614D91C|nr:GH32 C-terminal domain-containing protein [uncultured Metabacillus sp.]